MSRLEFQTRERAQMVVEGLYKDLERRIIASPPGQCPVDMAASFLKLCHAQTCGKCCLLYTSEKTTIDVIAAGDMVFGI